MLRYKDAGWRTNGTIRQVYGLGSENGFAKGQSLLQ
jgi:hypothetical protein